MLVSLFQKISVDDVNQLHATYVLPDETDFSFVELTFDKKQ